MNLLHHAKPGISRRVIDLEVLGYPPMGDLVGEYGRGDNRHPFHRHCSEVNVHVLERHAQETLLLPY